MSSVRARPTVYAGVQYRSRLEATWAAFFHFAGIKALYEFREDLDGYIPDFEVVIPPGYLLAVGGPSVLAEVKPALSRRDFMVAVHKIRYAGHSGEAMLLGANPATSYWLRSGASTFLFAMEWGAFPGLDDTGMHFWAQAQNATQWRAPACHATPGHRCDKPPGHAGSCATIFRRPGALAQPPRLPGETFAEYRARVKG